MRLQIEKKKGLTISFEENEEPADETTKACPGRQKENKEGMVFQKPREESI